MTNTMSNSINEKELETLLAIAESYGKKSGADHPQPDIALLIDSPIFKPYALDEKDFLIIQRRESISPRP
ncbi:MAG: hypothetical protein HYR81_02845 [Nitrospirae bacterium]|nr:hypothetical protein [Nitrospirota bacterium]